MCHTQTNQTTNYTRGHPRAPRVINTNVKIKLHSYCLHYSFYYIIIHVLIVRAGGGLGWMSGALNVILDWRWTFRILGIAGMVLAPITFIALWEPNTVRNRRLERRKGKKVYSIKVCCQQFHCRCDCYNLELIYSYM